MMCPTVIQHGAYIKVSHKLYSDVLSVSKFTEWLLHHERIFQKPSYILPLMKNFLVNNSLISD